MGITGAAFRQAHQGLDGYQGLSASAPSFLVESHSVNGAEYCFLRWELHDKAKVHLAETVNINNIELVDMFQLLYGGSFETTVGNEKLPKETAHHAVNASI